MTKHKHVAGGEKAHKIQTKVQNKTEKVLVVKIASYDSVPSTKKIPAFYEINFQHNAYCCFVSLFQVMSVLEVV